MSTLPTDPHDLALWLFDNLSDLTCIAGGSLWEGVLPLNFDFGEIEEHLGSAADKLVGACRADTRTIGFYPSHVHVYEGMTQFLSVAANRRRIPDRFTLRSDGFTYPSSGGTAQQPAKIAVYFDAVHLWSVLHELADVRNGGLLFVTSHDAQLEIRPDFSEDELKSLSSFTSFASEFGDHESHADQKRAITRTVLIDQFKPRRSTAFGDVLAQFENIATNARHSLAMYMAEFSVAKVKSEVERQNLDDTLSLNKTLSDIQNQLLALPAAILLAGATIKSEEAVRNYAVLVGVAVFSIFVILMVRNQRHSIDAIAVQIERRKAKVKSMPADSSASILPLFCPLEARIGKQKFTLYLITVVVVIVAFLTAVAVIDINHDGVVSKALGGALRWVVGLGALRA